VNGTYYCYLYDGNGLRVAKATASSSACSSPTAYELYWRSVSGETLAVTDGSGSTTNSSYHEYIFFAGRRVARSDPSSGNVYYFFVDQVGNTRAMTDQNGTVCFQMDYFPYGQENTPAGVTNTCSTSYEFTGYERDAETGLDYAFARYYNARMGRFMSPDPLGGDLTDPQTLNKYTYVRNNPVNFTDPSGLCRGYGVCRYDADNMWDFTYFSFGDVFSWLVQEEGTDEGLGFTYNPDAPILFPLNPGGSGGSPTSPQSPGSKTQANSGINSCQAKVAGNFALHGGTDVLNAGLSLIPGVGAVGPAAVALFSGIAVNLIDSNTTEGATATGVGFTAGAAAVFTATANAGTIAKVSADVAEAIPGVGTVLGILQLGYDAYHEHKQYEACKSGGN
jgi:RHS repeat-associated protein